MTLFRTVWERMRGKWGSWFDRAALAGIVWGILWTVQNVGQLITWQAAQNERWTALQVQLSSLYRADIAQKDFDAILEKARTNRERIDAMDEDNRVRDKRIDALERKVRIR